MSTPTKSNADIRGDDRAFKDALQRAGEELGRIKSVLGVGYGLKETKGVFSEDMAILVYVSKKRSDDELGPDERVPTAFDGYRTDVRVMLPRRKTASRCGDDDVQKTITGGIQIEAHGELSDHEQAFVGTLGCIVHKRGDQGDDNVYLLTNHHVLLDGAIGTRNGDGVYHPYFPRTSPRVLQGTLLGKIDTTLTHDGHVDENGQADPNEPSDDPNPYVWEIDPTYDGIFVDCAAVRIDLGSFCCGSACTRNDIEYATTIADLNTTPPPATIAPTDVNRVVDVRDLRREPAASHIGMRVIKNGRSTARTVGRITAVGPNHSIVRYPPDDQTQWRVLSFHYKVIDIVLADPPPAVEPCSGVNTFSDGGDSGALVVDEQNRAVGLLYAGSIVPNDAGIATTQACLIVPVLDRLGMCIPTTTGNSRGSSRATDGSGLRAHTGDVSVPRDDGTVVFAGRSIGAAPARARVPLASPATAEQRLRMQPLLDALLESQRGRALHDDFSQLSREIAFLVRRKRQVTVAWHRNHGPAFLACMLDHLRGDADSLPHEIRGVSRTKLLETMQAVLYAHGSNALRAAIERHRDLVDRLADAGSASECIALLCRCEEEVRA